MKKIFAVLFVLLMVFQVNAEARVLDRTLYPGARAYDITNYPYKAALPTTTQAFADSPQAYKEGCHASVSQAYVKVCKYGYTTGYNYTLAIIGDSHSGQWLGAIQQFATKYRIRIIYATKSGCGLSTDVFTTYPTCTTWNKNIIPAIAAYKPDLVLTKADYSKSSRREVPQGFINKFNELKARKIEVFAIRDTPYFDLRVPECVREYGRKSVKCKVLRSKAQPTPSNWDTLSTKPTNVHYFDYSNKFCGPTYCEPVIGNVMVMRDYHHMTDSYSRSMSYYILKDMYPVIKAAKARRLATT